jgi:hypothetical protein
MNKTAKFWIGIACKEHVEHIQSFSLMLVEVLFFYENH